MSVAVVGGVSRSRLSRTNGLTADSSATSSRAPSWFDWWKATRSTRSDGCTRVTPWVVANGAPAGSLTDRGGGGGGAVVVVVVGSGGDGSVVDVVVVLGVVAAAPAAVSTERDAGVHAPRRRVKHSAARGRRRTTEWSSTLTAAHSSFWVAI